MDSNEKKPKRPRIGQSRPEGEQDNSYERVNRPSADANGEESTNQSYQQRQYQPRPYQRPNYQNPEAEGENQGEGMENHQPRQQGGYRQYNNNYNNNNGF